LSSGRARPEGKSRVGAKIFLEVVDDGNGTACAEEANGVSWAQRRRARAPPKAAWGGARAGRVKRGKLGLTWPKLEFRAGTVGGGMFKSREFGKGGGRFGGI